VRAAEESVRFGGSEVPDGEDVHARSGLLEGTVDVEVVRGEDHGQHAGLCPGGNENQQGINDSAQTRNSPTLSPLLHHVQQAMTLLIIVEEVDVVEHEDHRSTSFSAVADGDLWEREGSAGEG
jgi:hypothetical protein